MNANLRHKLKLQVLSTSSILCWLSGFGLPVTAEMISFGSVSERALHRSYDLALSAIDTGIAKNKIREAKVAYYPTLTGSVNTEYVGGFGNQNTLQNQQAVVVGNTILPGNTRFQDAISLNGNYTIADFGARSNQLKAAKQHATSTEIQQKIHIRDLRLDILDAYTQALLAFKETKSKEHQFQLQSQLYELKTRLWHAGKISRIELGEQAIILKNTEIELQGVRQILGDRLNKLSSYTQEPYFVASVQMQDLDSDAPIRFEAFAPANSPDYKAYDLLIKEKYSELGAIRAQRMPQLVAFSNFVLYGANKGNWASSMGGIRPRAVYFGIGMQLPVFDGFKTRVAVDGKKLEIARLMTERDKKIWELRSDYEKSATAAKLFGVELSTRAELVTSSKDQLSMVIRLTESQVAERTKALTEQVDLVQRQLDEDTTRMKNISAVKRLKIYSEIASK